MSTSKINVGNPEVTTSTNILDIELPKELENAISTGWDHFDALCAGDGMIPSTVAILTGLPGSGKTTMALQLADSITEQVTSPYITLAKNHSIKYEEQQSVWT